MAGGSRTVSEPWKEQKPYLETGFKEAGKLYGQGSPSYYPGATLAGFTPAQTQAQSAVSNYVTGTRPAALQAGAEAATMGQLQGATPFTGGQMSDLLAGKVDTGANTPYADLMGKFGTETMNQLTGTVLPGIRQSLVEYHPGGSSVGNNIQAKAIAAANKQLVDKSAEMYGNAYQTAQGQRFPAAQMRLGQQQAGQAAYPSIMGAPLEMYGALGDVGAQQRAMQQEAINQAQQKYAYDASKDQTALSQYMANISGDYGGTTTQTPSALSSLGQLVGIMGGLGIV